MPVNLFGVVSEDAFNKQMDGVRSLLTMMVNPDGVNFTSAAGLQLLLDQGLHKSLPIGDMIQIDRETGITVSIGDSTGITAATVNEETFLAAVGEAHAGVYEASYDGAAWHKEDGTPIILSDFGISVTGTAAAGDHLVITETAAAIDFVLADYDAMVDNGYRSLVYLAEKIFTYGTIPFSSPQLMYATAAGETLPAGKYRFTLDHGAYDNSTTQDGTYCFTTTQAIPATGGWRCTSVGTYRSDGKYTKANLLAGKINTYDVKPQHAAIETNLSITEWDGEDTEYTDLGTFTAESRSHMTDFTHCNFTRRNGHGSNRYAHSCYRKWLNSTGKAVKSGDSTFSYWWTPSDQFDMPPSESARKLAGFLHGFDPEALRYVAAAKVVVEIPSCDRVTDGPTHETLEDKVWLASKTEIYGGTNITEKEGERFRLYQGTEDVAKIKTWNGSASYWWLRSAFPSLAYFARVCKSDGSLNSNRRIDAYGVVPGLIFRSRIPTTVA